MSRRPKRRALLIHPGTVVSSAFLGILFGWWQPESGAALQKLGKLYLSLLQMCVLPILITAVISSLGRLFSSGEAAVYLKRLFIVFGTGILIAGFLGVTVASVARPGAGLRDSAQTTVGRLLSEQEAGGQKVKLADPGVLGFVQMMIPTNPFESVTQGRNLPVIFFCILFGISLGMLRSASSATTLTVIEATFEAVLRLIGWVMYGLPVGLFCLFAAQVSQTGIEIFFALGRLVIAVYVGSLVLLSFHIFAVARATKRSIRTTISALRAPILVAMGTSSSFATIPVSLLTLQDRLGIDPNTSKLTVPLGVSLNPQGTIMYFTLAVLFMAQLYNVQLSVQGYVIVLVGSILGGMSSTGVPAVAALSVLSIVLDPLGLPSETAVIILLAINPLTDPILTCTNVVAQCAATSIVARDPWKNLPAT